MPHVELKRNEFATIRQHGLSALKSISALGYTQFEPRIRAAEKRLRHDRIKLLIVGEFSRGKSTFINAIVGEPLLPSKVTPTTATINVIRGGENRTVTVHYQDGKLEQHVLPDSHTNRFLSDIVTASNRRSEHISEVVLSVPGRLDRCLVDIVDTPGVNDLNKLREDVTFRYLNECDAAVVLLDAQQPLTESERQFLKQRVVAADVTKILFVINRIDEQVADADEGSRKHIVDVVRQRLIDEVGIENPQVFAISALQALKSRFYHEQNQYLERFEDFEEQFLSFANAQATIGRAEVHCNRILQIASDALVQIQNQLTATQMHGSEIQTNISNQEQKLRSLEQRVLDLPQIVDNALASIKPRLLSNGESDLMDRKTKLIESLSGIKSAAQIDEFHSQVQHSLQTWVDSLSRQAYKQSQVAAGAIRTNQPDLFTSSGSLIATSRDIPAKMLQNALGVDFDSTMQAPEAFGSSDMIFGGLTGLIATWLIGGPIAGILVGLIGTGIAGGVRKQTETEVAIEQKKARLKGVLEKHFDSMSSKLEEVVQKTIEHERVNMINALNERASVTLKAIQDSILALKRSAEQSSEQRERQIRTLCDKKEALLDIIQKNPILSLIAQ